MVATHEMQHMLKMMPPSADCKRVQIPAFTHTSKACVRVRVSEMRIEAVYGGGGHRAGLRHGLNVCMGLMYTWD